MGSTESSTIPKSRSVIPEIHLLCMLDPFITAFNVAKEKYGLPPSVNITIHNSSLRQLPTSVKFDAIVSPANSYARLDGAFDDALSRAFAPQNDYDALTRVAQAKIYREWRGFAPPSSCTLVDLDHRSLVKPGWDTRYLALMPTMKVPQNVVWDREVVYECIWALLACIDRHNRLFEEKGEEGGEWGKNMQPIKSFLMTPIATGCGKVSPDKWAAQTVLAIKHFVEAVENEEKWGRLDWGVAYDLHEEILATKDL